MRKMRVSLEIVIEVPEEALEDKCTGFTESDDCGECHHYFFNRFKAWINSEEQAEFNGLEVSFEDDEEDQEPDRYEEEASTDYLMGASG